VANFEEMLDIDLTLSFIQSGGDNGKGGGESEGAGKGGKGGGKGFPVASTQIKRVSLELRSWGFEAEVTFDITQTRSSDELFSKFAKTTLTKAEMVIQEDLAEDERSDKTKIKVTGYVTTKSVEEILDRSGTDIPVLYRRYTIRFVDAAQAFWRQHHPIDLFIDKNFQNVVDAHKGSNISITMDQWSPTQTNFPIHFVGLGAPGNRASFYDFVVWFTDTQNGVWTYDAASNDYKLTASKDDTATPVAFKWQEVGSIGTDFPETPRYEENVLNSYTANASTNNITNDQSVTGLRRDFLVRTSIDSDVTDRVKLETARLVVRESEVVVGFRDYPTMAIVPGTLIDFSHKLFGKKLYQASKTYRVRELKLEAETPSEKMKAEDAESGSLFRISLSLRLELKDEKFVPLPSYVEPRWPAFIEGTVVSETGDDGNEEQKKPPEETYQIYSDEKTSLDEYKVAIPLFPSKSSGGGGEGAGGGEEGSSSPAPPAGGGAGGAGGKKDPGKIVVVPYLPNTFPGHFYFPAYKHERVLLALSFRSAEIVQYLEWRAGARLPADGQGDHLLLGKKEKDQTSFSHAYDGNSNPVVTLIRTKDKDVQSIVIEEGKLTITVKENPDDSSGGGGGGGGSGGEG
jgi:hypothetical protein